MTTEEEITALQGEVDELKRLIQEVKTSIPVLPEQDKIDSVVNTSGEITDLYIGKDFLPLVDTNTTDHGSLGGLADDDHSQYHNNTRGDARYIYRENNASFTPDGDYEPATKKYVDDHIPDYSPFTYASGDNLLQTADTPTSISKNSETPVKYLEYTVQCHGELKIKWQASIAGTVTGYMRVYRDGVAVGTQETLNGSGNPTYMTQEISGWTAGDKLQIYGWRASDDSQDITMAIYDANFAEGNISAIYGDWAFTSY